MSNIYGAGGGYPVRSNPYLTDDGAPSRYGGADTFAATKYSSMYGGADPLAREIRAALAFDTARGLDHWGLSSAQKRPAEDLYHHTIPGSQTIAQTEALFSTNSLIKRPRVETASNLPIYPQRPGEKDCPHYMLTRTCKFGETCKFDHPVWVPEGGMPDWKEITVAPVSEVLPQRPGEPDCPYYMKTQLCKYGQRCKFNHPIDNLNASASGEAKAAADNSVLPERPSEPICSFYLKTGKCKFGSNCKFHHPKDVKLPTAGQDTGNGPQTEFIVKDNDAAGGDSKPTKTFVPFTPALLHNSKGLPIRLGEIDCPFYLKTGSCKFGALCRYNHPERISINPPVASSLGHSVMPSMPANLPMGVLSAAANIQSNINPLLAQASLGVPQAIYPQRPGQPECDFYMKSGRCSFGERCKFNHPIDRSAPTAAVALQAVQPSVKLTLAGLPRREGETTCPFYMKTGTCKYGANCRFDHPPPGEAIAMASAQGAAVVATIKEEVEEEEDEEA